MQNNGDRFDLADGSVVIAAITSCTNTSNPSLMLGAGLLAKKAVERGLTSKPWVKTSFAPGSKVVTDYIEKAGLWPVSRSAALQSGRLRLHHLHRQQRPAARADRQSDQGQQSRRRSVLSGNRNFEGRINPLCRANYLASPPLVVAYALAGRMDFDIVNEPLGNDKAGKPVYLRDIWPTPQEVESTMRSSVIERDVPQGIRRRFHRRRALARAARSRRRSLRLGRRNPPTSRTRRISTDMPSKPGAACRSCTACACWPCSAIASPPTTFRPPARFAADSPAGKYLIAHGVQPKDFNSYGARRGNHEVMMRGTFANIRLRNQLAPGTEGGWTHASARAAKKCPSTTRR